MDGSHSGLVRWFAKPLSVMLHGFESHPIRHIGVNMKFDIEPLSFFLGLMVSMWAVIFIILIVALVLK